MIQNMRPTSKVGLKQMCLMAAEGDLEKANRLYEYMIKDLDDLPVFDPERPTAMQQLKSGVGDAFQWINQNQDQLFQWANLLSTMIKGKGVPVPPSAPVNPVPPIN